MCLVTDKVQYSHIGLICMQNIFAFEKDPARVETSGHYIFFLQNDKNKLNLTQSKDCDITHWKRSCYYQLSYLENFEVVVGFNHFIAHYPRDGRFLGVDVGVVALECNDFVT